MIDKSMTGTDVAVVQAILTARGYFLGGSDGLLYALLVFVIVD